MELQGRQRVCWENLKRATLPRLCSGDISIDLNIVFKFFLVAKPKIRAERRHKQINDDSVKVDIIEEEIKQRDKTDSTREIAPLKKAVDAFKIDVSNLTINEVFNKILQKIKSD